MLSLEAITFASKESNSSFLRAATYACKFNGNFDLLPFSRQLVIRSFYKVDCKDNSEIR